MSSSEHRKWSWKKRLLVWFASAFLLCLLIAGVIAYCFATRFFYPPKAKPVFVGDSSRLKRTQVVATLDAPMEKGKNVVWCASFEAAWWALRNDVTKGPVKLEGGGVVVDSLNGVKDWRGDVPEKSLYAAAGLVNEGIVKKIHKNVEDLFPSGLRTKVPSPKGGFVAFGCLEAGIKFSKSYHQCRFPLIFHEGDGGKVGVSSFGIREEDSGTYQVLRDQARILYGNYKENEPAYLIIDLDRNSQPSQIIVAEMEREKTLAQMVTTVNRRIALYKTDGKHDGIGGGQELLVPDVVFTINHRFVELENHKILNPDFASYKIDVACENTEFRLDRDGAVLRSEAMIMGKALTNHCYFNRPFLILMRKRGSERPYFVMWVDNTELLKKMKPLPYLDYVVE